MISLGGNKLTGSWPLKPLASSTTYRRRKSDRRRAVYYYFISLTKIASIPEVLLSVLGRRDALSLMVSTAMLFRVRLAQCLLFISS